MAMVLTSTAFTANGPISKKYTGEGEDISPPLSWSGLPRGVKELALICDDPDAPRGTWVHWVLYDIPANATGLPEGVASAQLPAGTREGLNDWERTGYGGPCPPIGRHRYFHKLYALDTVLSDLGKPDKARLLEAMKGHVVAQGELIGTYQRNR